MLKLPSPISGQEQRLIALHLQKQLCGTYLGINVMSNAFKRVSLLQDQSSGWVKSVMEFFLNGVH